MEASLDDIRAAMESTISEFLEGSGMAIASKDASLLSTALTPDCSRHLRPNDFVARYPFVKAVESNTEHDARMVSAIKTMEETRVNIIETIIDPARRKASIYSEHWTKIVGCEANALEICWFLDFTEDGKKISRVIEFIDTASATRRIEAMTKQGFETSQDADSGSQQWLGGSRYLTVAL
ncbi:hypothetical protein GGS26DRAFT_561568 [Hypomontagnella submonticulosa]|nr:hypothetical protein GGS26DRAFT_561568 [Hypomontagnella submonticulosa]